MELLEELQVLLDSAKKDKEDFFTKKNATAGTRLRKKLQEMKSKCQDLRNLVTETKKK